MLAVFEQRKVGEGVSDVAEVIAEGLAEGSELVWSCEVEDSVGGENAVEEAEMFGNPFG